MKHIKRSIIALALTPVLAVVGMVSAQVLLPGAAEAAGPPCYQYGYYSTCANSSINDMILNDLLNSTNQIIADYNSGALTSPFTTGAVQSQLPDYLGSLNRLHGCGLRGGVGCESVINQALRMGQLDAAATAWESTYSDVYSWDRQLMSDRYQSELNQMADREYTRYESYINALPWAMRP